MKDAVNITLDTDEVEAGSTLSDDQTEYARRISIAVMRRGIRLFTRNMDVSADQYAAADQAIREWVDFALSEDARWLLN